ncbi:MAG: hypothetical protein QOE30_4607, partial [Mycobacterium sp.]|nr:hypothetical protein [Mycobacterium sp.]
MARHWFGRDKRPAEASEREVDPAEERPEIAEDDEAPEAADPQDDDAEPHDDSAEPEPKDDDEADDASESRASEEHTPSPPEGSGLAGRLAAATGHAITRLGAGAIARLPVLGAALLPRL